MNHRSSSKVFFSSAIVATLAFGTSSALAQDAPADPSTAPRDPAAAAPAAPVTAPAPAAPESTADEPQEKARFRWGISAVGGPLFTGGGSGGVGGIDARFGVQINNLIGVYGQPVLLIGAGADSGVSGASASALVAAGLGALADFTFSDLFYVAVGPELISAAGGSSSVGTAGSTASAYEGTFFSVAARAGLALGSMKPERRKAFTIGLDFRTIFTTGDPTITPLLALGFDSF